MPINANQLKQRLTEVLDAKAELKRLTSRPYSELSKEAKYAIRYQVIILAEALGGACLHMAQEDLKLQPLSFSECFILFDEKGICENCAEGLGSITKLRNLLIHRYWTIDDKRIYDSIKNDFNGVDKFLESIQDRYAIEL